MTPDSYTIKEDFIEVGDGHTVYAQLWGNPEATNNFVFLHGGPGSGCKDGHKDLFNPEKHRVLFFDQRGTGRSTPYGSLEANTTKHLTADITKLADQFGLDTFSIVGGSWGSCLALAYTLEQSARVKNLVLRGLFTGSQAEIDFIDKGEFRAFFPDVWEAFVLRTPEAHRANPSAYHLPRALSDDAQASKESSFAYHELEGSLISLDDRHTAPDFATFDPAPTRIELHYLANRCFMEDSFLINNASAITAKTWLVQGRYDAICAPATAYVLHKILPNSTLTWTVAGHSGGDRANADVTKTIIESIS